MPTRSRLGVSQITTSRRKRLGKRAGFRALQACLQDRYDEVSEWEDVILHANIHLIGPELYFHIGNDAKGAVEADVIEYLEAQYFANQERSRRILLQIVELAAALNERQIIPTFIKGAAVLLREECKKEITRISSDVDVVLKPTEQNSAIEVLNTLGYRAVEGSDWGHSSGSFARSDVVAAVDLHDTLPTAVEAVTPLDTIQNQGQPLQVDGANVVIPTPKQHILLNIAHEMLHDRHLAKGFTDLRYLFELSAIQRRMPNVPLSDFESRFSQSSRLRLAFELQDRMAQAVLGRGLFPGITHTRSGGLLHSRRMLKLQFPHLGQQEWWIVRAIRRPIW
ncbi:MAG: nucleotidyltransferase family protein [Pseudomonadota bacterium]